MRTNRDLLLSIIIAALLSSCGGGSSDSALSVFDGSWSGRLIGTSCLSNAPIELEVRHEVDADGDGGEAEASVSVVDQDGNEYVGPVILTANSVTQIWGFSAEAVRPGDGNSPEGFFYNIANRPEGQAKVEATITVPDDDSQSLAGCTYILSGILTKE